jgi:DNA-binding response OmpR family regulator
VLIYKKRLIITGCLTMTQDVNEQSDNDPLTEQLRVLVVEDEKVMRDLMALTLVRLGFAVTAVSEGPTALGLLEGTHFDLVMLDVVLPGMDGFDVLTELRIFSTVPVIMLTSLSRPEDIVRGFELGADNYITKPFNFKEVEARIMALVRRATHLLGGNAFEVAEYGDLRLLRSERAAMIGDRRIELTPNEYVLLRHLALRGDRPVSKEELLQDVWGYEGKDNANLVELAIRRLRTKLEENPTQPQRLVTVRGVGYKLVVKQGQVTGDR